LIWKIELVYLLISSMLQQVFVGLRNCKAKNVEGKETCLMSSTNFRENIKNEQTHVSNFHAVRTLLHFLNFSDIFHLTNRGINIIIVCSIEWGKFFIRKWFHLHATKLIFLDETNFTYRLAIILCRWGHLCLRQHSYCPWVHRHEFLHICKKPHAFVQWNFIYVIHKMYSSPYVPESRCYTFRSTSICTPCLHINTAHMCDFHSLAENRGIII